MFRSSLEDVIEDDTKYQENEPNEAAELLLRVC
jgi:hypothetical protein